MEKAICTSFENGQKNTTIVWQQMVIQSDDNNDKAISKTHQLPGKTNARENILISGSISPDSSGFNLCIIVLNHGDTTSQRNTEHSL